MKHLFLLLSFVALIGRADDLHMVETKTQVELENALSRLIPPQQFLIQVNADISQRLERRLVEGESFSQPLLPAAPKAKFEVMPGFTPEPAGQTAAPTPSNQAPERQIFRMVEVPVLESLRVRVDFDDKLPPDRVLRAKTMVKDYLGSHYPSQAEATFGRLPMISNDPAKDLQAASEAERLLRKYWPWLLTLAGAWLLWMSLHKPIAPTPMQSPGITRRVRKVLSSPGAALGMNKAEPQTVLERKKILLDRFLRKSDSFRLYYLSLDEAKQNDLAGLLVGPAFDSLMDGLGLFRTPGRDTPPGNEEEVLDLHEREFDDYARARDWQDQQFFGFLHQLSNDQLNTLLTHASPLAACVMLRFLKPAQSAYVLDGMSPSRRSEIFAQVPQVQVAALNDLAIIEKEIRASAQRMPRALFGSPKEDAEYWGRVLSESDQQDGILKALEKTNPELGPSLKQFRFKLEDAMSVDDDVLQRVLGDVDNDELALALTTLPDEVVEQFLQALSGRRRDLVAGQVQANKSTPPAVTRPARLALTKRFREALAA